VIAELEPMVRPASAEEHRALLKRELRSMSDEEVVWWILSLSVWDCFLTCTFRRPRSLHDSEKIFREWWQSNWFGVPCFYSIELHPGGHGGHIHGLMTLWPRGIKYLALWETWFKPYGRCSFEKPRDLKRTAGYSSPTTVHEVIKDGTWGLLGISLNQRKYMRSIVKTARQTSARELRSCDTEVTVEDVIEGKQGLPAPVLNQVDLWK
jgi:hypothetical protein